MAIATLVRRLTELGTSPDAIALVVEEIEAMQGVMDARKLAEKERKRRKREEAQKTANGGGNVRTEEMNGMSQDNGGKLPMAADNPQTVRVLPFPSQGSPPDPPLQTTPPLSPTPTLPLPIPETIIGRGRPRAWKEGDQVPDEWKREMAQKMRWSRSAVEEEATRFVDYALAHRKIYADWRAAWRNWCRSPYQKHQPANAIGHI